MESAGIEMQRRSFLQLLAAIPMLGATGAAMARLAPETAARAVDATILRMRPKTFDLTVKNQAV